MRHSLVTCTRRHQIAVGHRVVGQGGKCEHLHGHNLTFEFTCGSAGLDEVGRVIDFGVIKTTLCAFIEQTWDHKMLIWSEDPMLPALRDLDPEGVVAVPFNPTSENIAIAVANAGDGMLKGTGVRVVRVTVHETDKCRADWRLFA